MRALERVQTLPPERESPPRDAYMAIAYCRLDREQDGWDVLDKGGAQFGGNLLIEAARSYMDGSSPDGSAGTQDRGIVAQSVEQMSRLTAAMTIFSNWICNGFVPVTNLTMPPWLRMREG